MAMQILLALSYLVAVGLSVSLLWGVPSYFIWQESAVSVRERKMWVTANIFFPWLAFFAFLLVAPIEETKAG